MRPSVALFTDSHGLQVIRGARKLESASVIVGSDSRPEYREDLRSAAKDVGAIFLEQPKSTDEYLQRFFQGLELAQPDVVLCCSYSRLIPAQVLQLARHGGVNVHYALLPKNRGKHPIQWAILNGEKVAGVTIHEMSPEIDQGPIIDQSSTPIDLTDTWRSVSKRLDHLAEDLIVKNWDSIVSGNWTGLPQNDAQSTRGEARDSSHGEIDWDWPVMRIHDLIRALVPPLPPAFYRDQRETVRKITSYLPIQDVFELKYRLRPEAFLFPTGRVIPSSQGRSSGSTSDFSFSFSFLSQENRAVATFELVDYIHEASSAAIRVLPDANGILSEELALVKSFIFDWVTAELALHSLEETS